MDGWTTATLRTNLLTLLHEHDTRYEQRFAAYEASVRALAELIDERINTIHAGLQTLEARMVKDMDTRDMFLGKLAEERSKQVNQAFEAQQSAVQKAEAAAEKRFDAVNEFRQQLNDQALGFMPRRESELQVASLLNRVDQLQQSVQSTATETMPRGEVRVVLDGLTTRVDGMGATVGNLQTLLASLRSSLSGQSQGSEEVRDALTRNRSLVFGVAGALSAVFGLALALVLAFR